jgi:hypothetical protein
MTEAEWLACAEPTPMFRLLEERLGPRKWRLFGVACCQPIRHLLAGGWGWAAVEVAELFADGLVTTAELEVAHDTVLAAVRANCLDGEVMHPSARHYAWQAAADVTGAKPRFCWLAAQQALAWEAVGWKRLFGPEAVYAWVCSALREMSHYPCRPLPPLPRSALAWNGGTVHRMAKAAYDERAFDRLPVLADALEEAGCANPDLLGHLRGPGPHARGCWALDLLLGKE